MIGSTFPRVSMLAGILLVPLLASTVVAFSECGSLVPGEGCLLFRTDSGELYAIANADGWEPRSFTSNCLNVDPGPSQ